MTSITPRTQFEFSWTPWLCIEVFVQSALNHPSYFATAITSLQSIVGCPLALGMASLRCVKVPCLVQRYSSCVPKGMFQLGGIEGKLYIRWNNSSWHLDPRPCHSCVQWWDISTYVTLICSWYKPLLHLTCSSKDHWTLFQVARSLFPCS